MLENKLYIIEHKEEDGENITFTIRQNKSNEIFKAHFPGNPITPGACLVEIARELCEKHIGKSLKIRFLKSVKFLNIITPIANEFLKFDISLSPADDNAFDAKIQIISDENVYTKINFKLA
jgi:3-hydroxyacyl-[acyl-carrier-protein] dehydratase